MDFWRSCVPPYPPYTQCNREPILLYIEYCHRPLSTTNETTKKQSTNFVRLIRRSCGFVVSGLRADTTNQTTQKHKTNFMRRLPRVLRCFKVGV